MERLTRKQKRFIEEYIIDCNATQAAIRAGYKESNARQTATENLAKPYISEAIKRKLAEISSERVATAREVLEYLTSVMRGEQTEQIIRFDENGGQVVDHILPSTKERLKAAELIGKRYGIFKETYDIESTSPVIIVNDLKE